MSIRELETHSGADVFVEQLSVTARHTVLQALMKSKYLQPAQPVVYTAEQIATIESQLQTQEGVLSEADYLKACGSENPG
jgi:hypothetical protein